MLAVAAGLVACAALARASPGRSLAGLPQLPFLIKLTQELDRVCREPSVALVQTSRGGGNLKRQPDKPQVADFEFHGPVVDIDASLVDQEIEGFGGAFTEASAIVFKRLTRELQEHFLEKHFSSTGGLGYTLGRVHINSCDFSASSYSYDDVRNDFSLLHFDHQAAHDSKALIPFIKRAMDKVAAGNRSLRLLATPWSPPAWMKANGRMGQSHAPCLRRECRTAWAHYISKWITAYKRHDIPIWALSVQNEPTNNASWEACLYTPEEEADFLGHTLGPTLRAEHPDVAIFIYDDSKHQMYDFARAVYEHEWASQYVDGVAFHWYTGDLFQNVAQVHQEFPQAKLLPSEATYEKHMWRKGAAGTYPDWRFGEGYAHDIIGDLNAGAVGWIDWNLLLDTSGGPNHVGNVCDAAVVAGLHGQELHFHPQHYFIGHFSKFILPGSKRLLTRVRSSSAFAGAPRPYGTCTGEDGLEATAFVRRDQRVVAVVLNCAHHPVHFKLQLGGGAVNASIPAHAIQTYIFQGCDISLESTKMPTMPLVPPAAPRPMPPEFADPNSPALKQRPTCSASTPCPVAWKSMDDGGGYFCKDNNGCRPIGLGPWPTCTDQCVVKSSARFLACPRSLHGMWWLVIIAALVPPPKTWR